MTFSYLYKDAINSRLCSGSDLKISHAKSQIS
jgi:hypothetical protein